MILTKEKIREEVKEYLRGFRPPATIILIL